MKNVSSKIKNLDNQIILLLDDINNSLLYIPNTIHQSVPIGTTEDDNVIIREFGNKPSFDFQKNTPRSIYNKMNKTQRDLLGFRFNPPKDEFTRDRAKQKKHQKPENYTLPV